MRTSFKHFHWLLALALFWGESGFAQEAYNEVFDSSGALRPHYQRFIDLFGNILQPSSSQIRTLTVNPLNDKIQILPIPLVLSQKDEILLTQGIQQRTTALRELFYDLVVGDQRIIEAGVIPRKLVEWEFTFADYPLDVARTEWKGRTRADIRFLSGADIVRGADGQFVVLEDNIGEIGGLGDYEAILQVYLKAWGLSPEQIKKFSPRSLLADAVMDFLHDAGSKGSDEKSLIFMKNSKKDSPDVQATDDEDLRRLNLLKSLNVKIAKKQTETLRKSVLAGQYSKIVNLSSIDESGDWVKDDELRRSLIENGVAQFKERGPNVVGSKAFLPFMDRIIEFYTKQRPLIRTQHTELLVDYKVPKGDWVVKKTDGLQGNSVFILDKMTKDQTLGLQHTLETWKAWGWQRNGNLASPVFVKQKRTTPSVVSTDLNPMNAYYADIRWLAYNNGEAVTLADHPWGRAISILGDGLNNVSRGSFELVVLKSSCAEALGE